MFSMNSEEGEVKFRSPVHLRPDGETGAALPTIHHASAGQCHGW